MFLPARYFVLPRLSHLLRALFGPSEVVEEEPVVIEKVPSRLPCCLIDTKLSFQDYWDAVSNTPKLYDGEGVKGQYYIVARTGNTLLDGRNEWPRGYIVVFDGKAWLLINVEVPSV